VCVVCVCVTALSGILYSPTINQEFSKGPYGERGAKSHSADSSLRSRGRVPGRGGGAYGRINPPETERIFIIIG